VVIDTKTRQILGAQVVGASASNLIAEMGLAIASELTVDCLTDTVHAHPTLSEAWMEAALIATGAPLHLPPRRGA
jgi:dihydrolipoamide dehydrogenase